MRRILAASFVVAVAAASAFGQLTVSAVEAKQLQNIKNVAVYGDVILLEELAELSPSLVPVAAIRVSTEAANVTVDASDQQRMPTEVLEIDRRTYLINTPGRHWVDVTAIDFDKNLYARKVIVVEIDDSDPEPPGPGPDPPGPGPDPDPPGPCPDPNGPFDGLAAKVYGIAKTFSDKTRSDIAALMQDTAMKLRTFDFVRVDQAAEYISRNWPCREDGCPALWEQLYDYAKNKRFSHQEAQAFYLEVARGCQ